jgi:hypothetical protein
LVVGRIYLATTTNPMPSYYQEGPAMWPGDCGGSGGTLPGILTILDVGASTMTFSLTTVLTAVAPWETFTATMCP